MNYYQRIIVICPSLLCFPAVPKNIDVSSLSQLSVEDQSTIVGAPIKKDKSGEEAKLKVNGVVGPNTIGKLEAERLWMFNKN